MYCFNCQKWFNGNSKSCKHCGTKNEVNSENKLECGSLSAEVKRI